MILVHSGSLSFCLLFPRIETESLHLERDKRGTPARVRSLVSGLRGMTLAGLLYDLLFDFDFPTTFIASRRLTGLTDLVALGFSSEHAFASETTD